jgi:hypothetical protein
MCVCVCVELMIGFGRMHVHTTPAAGEIARDGWPWAADSAEGLATALAASAPAGRVRVWSGSAVTAAAAAAQIGRTVPWTPIGATEVASLVSSNSSPPLPP